MSESPAEYVEARALRWFARGQCLTESDAGDTFLVRGAIPGELVQVRRTMGPRNTRVSSVSAVRSADDERITPRCPHASTCTGCALLHVSTSAELVYKALCISEVLQRYADFEIDPAQIAVFPDAERGDHRTRARFRVRWVSGGPGDSGSNTRRPILGLADSVGEIQAIDDCPANSAIVRQTMCIVAKMLPAMPQVTAVEVIEGAAIDEAAQATDGGDRAPRSRVRERVAGVVLEVDANTASDDDWIPHGLRERVAALGVRVGQSGRGAANPTRVVHGQWPAPIVAYNMPQVRVGPDVWTQPTPRQAAVLHDWVVDRCDAAGKRVIDATTGTGGMAFALAERATYVLGVDRNYAAVVDAQAGAKALGLGNVEFRGGKFETVGPRLAASGERFDVALVNPMRNSLGAEAMQAIHGMGVRRVVYVGPAPAAAAKDLRVLLELGYRLTEVAGCNLHPGTGHVVLAVVAELDAP